MKRIIEFPLENEETILVEVEEPTPEGGALRVGRNAAIPEKARQTFTEALGTIRPAAESIIDRIRELTDQPDTVIVEFGIKLSAEAGAFIASTGAEANFKVTLNWTTSKEKT
jgi:hypothetical protein